MSLTKKIGSFVAALTFSVVLMTSPSTASAGDDFNWALPQTQKTVQTQGFASIKHVTDVLKIKLPMLDLMQAETNNVLAQPFNHKLYKDTVSKIEATTKLTPGPEKAQYKLARGGSASQLFKLYIEYDSKVKNLNLSSQKLQEKVSAYEYRMEHTPSVWPTDSTDISSHFGYRISPGGVGSTNHQGIDISGYHGAPIYASAGGTVTLSRWYYGYGYLVEIDHGNGLTTRYAHNSQLLVYEGSKVKKGQLIAKMGDTGYATGTHSHFEVRTSGRPVNPLRYVNVPNR